MKTMIKKTTKSRLAILATIVSLSLGSADSILAQGVSINGTGARADTSAILDITSTTKGFLMAVHFRVVGLQKKLALATSKFPHYIMAVMLVFVLSQIAPL